MEWQKIGKRDFNIRLHGATTDGQPLTKKVSGDLFCAKIHDAPIYLVVHKEPGERYWRTSEFYSGILVSIKQATNKRASLEEAISMLEKVNFDWLIKRIKQNTINAL